MDGRVLVVDDDKLVNEFLQETLRRLELDVVTASSGLEAWNLVQESEFDLILTDVRMPELDGIALLDRIKEQSPDTTVVIITAFGTIRDAVEAMKRGAYDYVLKPVSPDEIQLVVQRGLEMRRLEQENRLLRAEVCGKYSFDNIVGQNRRLMDIFDLIRTAAQSKATILLTGESGTGKELVAKAIHYNSPRKEQPFIRVNCAALPENLVESELFGHEKGAFTGAIRQNKGRFELAHGGTLLLDEISEMPYQLQSKLLRVLQESEFERVGSGLPIKVDVRLIATTNRNLRDEIRKGKFREDLFYRLNVISIEVPPLRNRKDDIPILVDHFIRKYNSENERGIQGITERASQLLMSYPWPGNVRELENLVHRAVVTAKEAVLTHKDFPSYLALGPSGDLGTEMLSTPISIAEGEKILILKALERHSGNRTRAAEELGVTTRTLRNKLHEYGMKEE